METPRDRSDLDESRRELLLDAVKASCRGGGDGGEDGPPRSFLIFSIGGERFAADLVHVRRIFRSTPIARVPGASPEVLGLMNSHGEVLCVLDLRMVLGLRCDGPLDPAGSFVVVLHFGEREAGFLADSTDDVWELPASAVAPVLESLEPAKAKFYEGTLSKGGRFAGVLSPSMCLNP